MPVRASSVFYGDGWMGVKMRDASVVKGVGVLPLFAGLIGLLLLAWRVRCYLAARGTLIADSCRQRCLNHTDAPNSSERGCAAVDTLQPIS